MVQLPSTITEAEVATWNQTMVTSFNWDPFVRDVVAAAKAKRPMLFVVERILGLVKTHPDIFLTIPALRPSDPPVSLRASLPVDHDA